MPEIKNSLIIYDEIVLIFLKENMMYSKRNSIESLNTGNIRVLIKAYDQL